MSYVEHITAEEMNNPLFCQKHTIYYIRECVFCTVEEVKNITVPSMEAMHAEVKAYELIERIKEKNPNPIFDNMNLWEMDHAAFCKHGTFCLADCIECEIEWEESGKYKIHDECGLMFKDHDCVPF